MKSSFVNPAAWEQAAHAMTMPPSFMNDVSRMPQEFAASAARGDAAERARVVADYIAGMTDRYAFAEHKRISG